MILLQSSHRKPSLQLTLNGKSVAVTPGITVTASMLYMLAADQYGITLKITNCGYFSQLDCSLYLA